MADSKEEKAKKDRNKNASKETERSKSRSSGEPKRSGEVKGPMGVSGRKKPTDSAHVKKPAKTVSPTAESGKNTTTAKGSLPTTGPGKTKSLPKPKKALPEKGSKSQESKLPSQKDTALDSRNFDRDPIEEQPPLITPLPRTKTSTKKKGSGQGQDKGAQKTKEKNSPQNPAGNEEKEQKKRPKKMARGKPDPSISAEEKMKLPNTSPSDDLKKTILTLAQEIGDKIPSKKQEDLEKIAKDLLPNTEDVKKTVDQIKDTLASAPEKAKDLLEELLLEEDRAAAESAAQESSKDKKKEQPTGNKADEATLITDYDIHLFKSGKHYYLYKKLGSHPMEHQGTEGVFFALWAPNARSIAVMGDFNNWSKDSHLMRARWDHSGIWEIFIPEAKKGDLYKYFISSANGYQVEKGDPFAFAWETPPDTASMVWDLEYTWKDSHWMKRRKKQEQQPQPLSVYELHLGSWKRIPEEDSRFLTYRELAEELPVYLNNMGFTHVEFMPVMEHPFYGSWGYQITGYFAPSSRFGTPQDFMHLIDSLHQAGIGVILDWVPSHFPSDRHGLHYFDGTFLFEHADPRKGFHPDWQSYIFNYGRNEVRAFLISNALFWLETFHADGLRVDAVASMLYLDYSRKEGEWEPNEFGGRENLEAISFLKEFNEVVYQEFPDVVTIAEESTAWPMVSRPTYLGGLGFGMKWMMGWMHDTLEYFRNDPIHRRHHQNVITFSMNYAFSENFMLPFSHDEVVYGKGSLLNKMPGDQWNKFANLRALYAYMFAHPGANLLFMGSEFGQLSEWNHDSSLEWHLILQKPHQQLQETVKALNQCYRSEPALYEKAFSNEGFEWIDIHDEENSIISFLRKGNTPEDNLLVICNFTPVPREHYRIGVPEQGPWKEIFNSDDQRFGGSNIKNDGDLSTETVQAHQRDQSLVLTLPPLAVVYLKKNA